MTFQRVTLTPATTILSLSSSPLGYVQPHTPLGLCEVCTPVYPPSGLWRRGWGGRRGYCHRLRVLLKESEGHGRAGEKTVASV